MIHPALRLAVAQPALLAEHAAAYACLFGEELALGSAHIKRRLLCQLAALLFVAVERRTKAAQSVSMTIT